MKRSEGAASLASVACVASVACLAGLATILGVGDARAYCRTSSCNEGSPHSAAVCDPPYVDDCGIPIAWPQPCVEYSVQEDGSPKRHITFADTEQVMSAAMASWMNADCTGGGHPLMVVTEGPPAVCQQHEYNSDAGNANIVMYHDDSWPYEGQPGTTLALTTVTYTQDTGEIYDADMELDSFDNAFTLGDTDVQFDLLSIVTHESGHFLGMAHSHDPSATMWPEYVPGTTSLRHLTADDQAGICAIYPPGAADPGCDPTPRHGFSPCCAAEQGSSAMCAVQGGDASQSCACVLPGGGGHDAPAGALAVLGAWLAGRRRKRRG